MRGEETSRDTGKRLFGRQTVGLFRSLRAVLMNKLSPLRPLFSAMALKTKGFPID